MRKIALIVSLVLVAVASGCTTKETLPPPLTGPSEFALRLALQAVPDSILQDGASQAGIHIEATGVDGRPARALPVRIEIGEVRNTPDGELTVFHDFGTLSAKTVVTGEDGRARAVYTAPPSMAPSAQVGTATGVIKFFVTPVGSDFQGEQERSVSLRLLPVGVIQPPNNPPVPAFTTTGTLQPFNDIVFDASDTGDEGTPCGASCTYRWDFGDGQTATGIFAKHQFRAPGTYQVKLTVTDGRGASTTIARPVEIGAATAPTASFTFSPASQIAPGQTIFFNAEGSRHPAPGRRIVAYNWDFGSGTTGTGITTTKSYSTPGTYRVTLVVTDDTGVKSAPFEQTVVVGTLTTLTASLTVTPSTSVTAPGTTATDFLFDASASSGPSPIVEYRFNLGDGSPDGVQTTRPSWSHRYSSAGIYTVRLTVRDTQGRSASTTRTIYVQ